MDQEELEKLAEKIKSGNATKEETSKLLNELLKNLNQTRDDLKKI